MKKIIAASVAAVALAAAIPLAATAGADRDGRHGKASHADHHGKMDRHGGIDRHGMKGHHHRGHDRDRGAKARMLEMIEIYDADGDGSVTQEEVDRFRADRLAEFDADGDGQLSIDEYEQLWLDAMRERMVDRFQGHDDDGDGQVTVEEFGERAERLVLRRDRNEDGAVSLDDLRRGHRDHHDQRRERPQQAEEPAGQPSVEPAEQQ